MFFRTRSHKPVCRPAIDIRTPKRQPKRRPLSTKERAKFARDHWERNHGEHKDLYNSNLDISFSPVILGHHQQIDDPATDDDVWAVAAPTLKYHDNDQWAASADIPSDIDTPQHHNPSKP